MSRKSESYLQPSLFGDDDSNPSSANSSTFVDNMALPVHRWFRYSAGFSALWVRDAIRSAKALALGPVRVLDPFAGSGTVLVEAAAAQVSSVGVESHPFVARVARVKVQSQADGRSFREYGRELLQRADQIAGKVDGYPALIRKCYPDEPLAQLDRLRSAWLERQGETYTELGWLALAAILRQCSPVGTANWQYVLPKKSKAKTSHPFAAFQVKVEQMSFDLAQRQGSPESSTLIQGDARTRGRSGRVCFSGPHFAAVPEQLRLCRRDAP